MTLAGPFSTYQRIEFSDKVKKAALARSGGRCEGTLANGDRCPNHFTAANPAEFDHHLESWEHGDASLDNCKALGGKCCHVKKTGQNKTRRAKADRQSHESRWIKRSSKNKKKIPSRPFPKRWQPPAVNPDPDT
jgi:hypothetical protein